MAKVPLILSGRPALIVTMYVRKTTRRYKDKTYTNYLLVESIHTPNGPRQKVVCSLGDLSPRPAEEWLRLARKVEEALAIAPGDGPIQEFLRAMGNRHRAEIEWGRAEVIRLLNADK